MAKTPPPPPPKKKAPDPPPEKPRPKGPISEIWTLCTIEVGEGEFHRGYVDLLSGPKELTIEAIRKAQAKYGPAFMAGAKPGPYYTVLDSTDSQFKTVWGGSIEAGAHGILYTPPKRKRAPPPPGKQAKDRVPPPPPRKGPPPPPVRKKKPPPPP